MDIKPPQIKATGFVAILMLIIAIAILFVMVGCLEWIICFFTGMEWSWSLYVALFSTCFLARWIMSGAKSDNK